MGMNKIRYHFGLYMQYILWPPSAILKSKTPEFEKDIHELEQVYRMMKVNVTDMDTLLVWSHCKDYQGLGS